MNINLELKEASVEIGEVDQGLTSEIEGGESEGSDLKAELERVKKAVLAKLNSYHSSRQAHLTQP